MPGGGDGGGGMTDTREALARLIEPDIWEIGWEFEQKIARASADRILAAGWRPPEPQAAPVAAEVLEMALAWGADAYPAGVPKVCHEMARALLAEHARAESLDAAGCAIAALSAPAAPEVPDGR